MKHHFSFEPLEDRCLLAVVSGNPTAFARDLIGNIPVQCGSLISTEVEIDVENLNSKPDSIYSVYLDFNGHVTSNTT